MNRLVKITAVLGLFLFNSSMSLAVEDADWAVSFQDRQQLVDALDLEVEEMRELVILFQGRGLVYEDDVAAGTDVNLQKAETCTEAIATSGMALATVAEGQFEASKQALKTSYESCWDTLDILDDELGSAVAGALEAALEGGFAGKAAIHAQWNAYIAEINGELQDLKTLVALQPETVRLTMEAYIQGITDAVALMNTTTGKIDNATEAQWEEVEFDIEDAWISADVALIEAYRVLLSDDEDSDDGEE